LLPSPTQFHIFSATANAAEKLVITGISLKVRRLAISNNVLLNIERTLQTKNFEYPIRHTVVRTGYISPGQTLISNLVLCNGLVPRLILITFVEGNSFQGAYLRNPFNFTMNDCQTAQITVNGQQVPQTPYNPKKSMLEPYLNSLKVVKKFYMDTDHGVI